MRRIPSPSHIAIQTLRGENESGKDHDMWLDRSLGRDESKSVVLMGIVTTSTHQ